MPALLNWAIAFAAIGVATLVVVSLFGKPKTERMGTGDEDFGDDRAARARSRATERTAPWKWTRRAGLISFIVAGVFLFFSCFVIVSTKNVGIQTSFGATAGELSNGLHAKPPWYKVTEMDAAIQTDNYVYSDDPEANTCLAVRIANQQTGCLTISIRWRICTSGDTVQSYVTQDGKTASIKCHAEAADELFKDFRTFDHVRDSLVTRELLAAANNAFGTYNPLDSIKLNTPANGKKNPSLLQLSNRVTSRMRSEIGDQIEVMKTIVSFIHYDDATQQKINQLQQQVAQTRIADAAKRTNEKQALANKALAQSVNSSPNVLVAQCMSTLEEMVKTQQPVPAGFSCWQGQGLAGVIADSRSSGSSTDPVTQSNQSPTPSTG